MRRLSFQKLLQTPLMQKQYEKKGLGKREMTRTCCRQEYRPRLTTLRFVFTTISVSKKNFFFQSAS